MIAAALGLASLAGCATTQQEAARLQLNDARIRASQLPLRLGPRDRTVSPVSVTLIGGSGDESSAVVVTLRNAAPHATSDLPVLVGISAPGGSRVYLNREAGVNYFQNHAPAIPADGVLRWVLTVGRRLRAGSTPFAYVGTAAGPTATRIPSLPALRATAGRGALVKVDNVSSVPQYQLQVYALAQRGDRYVAAGEATVAQLGSDTSAQVRLPLVGDTAGATVSLEVPPTTFN